MHMLSIGSLQRLTLAAASLTFLAACAATPAPAGPAAGPSAPAAGPAAPTLPPTINFAATSQWVSEERLLPLDPILALVGASGSVNDQLGLSMTCNPDNGKITARLGRQPAARVGQNVIYRLRLGAEATPVEGRIEPARMGGAEPEFVFEMKADTVRAMAALDTASVVTDGGEVQWSFVKDPAASVQARYVGSLRNFGAESQAWLVFCNPK